MQITQGWGSERTRGGAHGSRLGRTNWLTKVSDFEGNKVRPEQRTDLGMKPRESEKPRELGRVNRALDCGWGMCRDADAIQRKASLISFLFPSPAMAWG